MVCVLSRETDVVKLACWTMVAEFALLYVLRP
jgi:hypothetical protein